MYIAGGALFVDVHCEIQASAVRHCLKVLLDEFLNLIDGDTSYFDVHHSGFDLGEIEDFVDQSQQV